MNKFKTSYNSMEELYKTELSIIKNIKFTFREIDLIACIISNKGEKKIASLCDISPRTVSSHVYNIMNKIGYNSKDQIIEFIEFSGKLLIFREYYLHLMTKSYFHKLLGKIGKVNKEEKKLYVLRSDEAQNPEIYLALKKDLKIANIILESCSEKYAKFSFLIDLKKLGDGNYYTQSLKYINQASINIESEKSVEDFNRYFQDIQEMFEGRQAIKYSPKKLYRKKHLLLISILFTFFCFGAYKYSNDLPQISEKSATLQEFISLLKESEISANNITSATVSKNQSLIKRIEKIVEYSKFDEVQNFFKLAEMESDTIANYMHVLQALASYNMYNRHDGKEARNILLLAKNAAENYINARSNMKLNFEELSPEELLSELKVFQHMPELYTRILYSLARIYFYIDSQDIQAESIKYFKTARYLGENLNLFEGYLSELSGILLIDSKNILNDKQNTKEIYDIIKRYVILQNNSKEYILDYNPKIKAQAKIIPSDNIYNILSCESYILEMYQLILSNGGDNIIQYSDEFTERVKNYIRPDINFLNGKVPQKKIAGLYNILGNILIIMKQKNLNDSKVKPIFQKILNSESSEILDYAQILLKKSVALSRNADYTKADAYMGLSNISQYKLEKYILSDKEKTFLKSDIEKYNRKKEVINSSLHRQNIHK